MQEAQSSGINRSRKYVDPARMFLIKPLSVCLVFRLWDIVFAYEYKITISVYSYWSTQKAIAFSPNTDVFISDTGQYISEVGL